MLSGPLYFPRLLHISRRGGEGEIDKRNIEIAAMTNYIGSKEGRKGGGQEKRVTGPAADALCLPLDRDECEWGQQGKGG